tara:strand:- start:540 stop:818 length:279 start_codon:yes stop_codon:yes gene_type:complete
MSEKTTKNNNIILTGSIIALIAAVGYFAFNSTDSTETDATIVAIVENDQVVEEVIVVANQETTEVTAEMVVSSTNETPENEIKPESSEDKSE